MLTKFFCLLAFIAAPLTAFAGEIVNIDQSKIRVSVAPGTTAAGVINVENNSQDAKTVRVYLEDWFYTPPFDGSKDFTLAGGTKRSCADWITFSPSEMTLAPYGRQKINYSVKVPEGVEGGRYAVMFFENSMGNQQSSGGVGVNVSLRLACLFYIEPEGTVKLDAAFDNLNVKDSPKGLNISLDVANKGNSDMTCQGTFNMMDDKGMVHARGEMSTVYTMPGDTGTARTSWSLPLPKGTYDLIMTFDLGKAREDAGIARGPVVVKETAVEIGENGEVLSVGTLK